MSAQMHGYRLVFPYRFRNGDRHMGVKRASCEYLTLQMSLLGPALFSLCFCSIQFKQAFLRWACYRGVCVGQERNHICSPGDTKRLLRKTNMSGQRTVTLFLSFFLNRGQSAVDGKQACMHSRTHAAPRNSVIYSSPYSIKTDLSQFTDNKVCGWCVCDD